MKNILGVRKHRCSYCNNTYVKAEHLARHERIHTGSKPFRCAQCKRRFSRQDSLLRHTKRYGHHADQPDLGDPELSNNTPSSDTSHANVAESPVTLAQPSGSLLSEAHVPVHEMGEVAQTGVQDDFSIDDTSFESFMPLTWPDSEELLQSILAADCVQLPQSLVMLHSQPVLRDLEASPDDTSSPWISTGESHVAHGGTQAVRSLSQMIANLSANMTAEAEATLTTTFLDGCLHMFFTQFVPAFPIVHRPTFVFRDWTHPLLLNAIALGSSFIGQKDSVAKGEMLWKLAHTAVATSWHTMIKHRGPFDPSDGVQLLLTALFGQVYATLSRDATLRKTAQVFHSLGYYWARECGMYQRLEAESLRSIDATGDELAKQWKSWAANEVQLRSLLGHYILDGQLAQYTGAPTCQRHASNPLPLPCSDALFAASTSTEWKALFMYESAERMTFRDLFNALFVGSNPSPPHSSGLSVLTVRIALEGLYSFIAEASNTEPAVGVPTGAEVSRALGRLYLAITSSIQMSVVDKLEALFRWHAISLDSATESGRLCQTLCQQLDIQQNVFGGRKYGISQYEIKDWVNSPQARRGLLHAIAIRDALQDLPLARAHAIHIPASIFAAATIYSGFILAGIVSASTPLVSDWEQVMAIDLDSPGFTERMDDIDGSFATIQRYLHSGTLSGETSSRNLLYDFNLFYIHIKSLVQPWGISKSMHHILERWLARFDG